MIGALLGGIPVEQRMSGSVTAAVMAAVNGASIVRVHDVKETVEAISLYNTALDVWMTS
jgi:dihydropteroate synthase